MDTSLILKSKDSNAESKDKLTGYTSACWFGSDPSSLVIRTVALRRQSEIS